MSGYDSLCGFATSGNGSVSIQILLDLNPHRRALFQVLLVSYGMSTETLTRPINAVDVYPSSAKDQLTGVSVAVKKIMKPFSTPVLAKRTYRELKLLKHIQHENVRTSPFATVYRL